MTIRISNDSVSVLVRGYACATLEGQRTIVWLELAPQPVKAVGAIWASLVGGTRERLTMRDEAQDRVWPVCGLNSRYHRLTADAPALADRSRPKLLRLLAPQACRIRNPAAWFAALAWPGLAPGSALAAMLERGTHYPVQIGWGPYLLAAAEARGHATPLDTGGAAPNGYALTPAPWDELIADGVRSGQITLDGQCHMQHALPIMPVAELMPA